MQPPHESLRDYPLIVTTPVLWGDQDAFGHVNNLLCLRWSETARVEYLTRIGFWPKGELKIGPILASITCHYRRPLNYPDTVHIGARVARIGNTSVRMEHTIVSVAQDAIAAELESTLVMLNYEAGGRPIPVSAEMREAIRKFEGRDLETHRKHA